MKYAVVGNREGFSKDKVFEELDMRIKEGDVIISGGASGVDSYAEEYAIKNNIEFIIYKPDYSIPSPQRYFKRNLQIVEDCDSLIAFNKKTRSGTVNTINHARRLNKPIIIISIKWIRENYRLKGRN